MNVNNQNTLTLTLTLPPSLTKAVEQAASPQQFIIEALEFYLQYKQTSQSLPDSYDDWAFNLCGIWDDPRPAEEIVDEIISARTSGREIVL